MIRRALLAVLLSGGAAQAQTLAPEAPAAGGVVVYEPDFFAPFSPRTALDMVERVPGFTIAEIDDERRGFAGAAGNVLINGETPTAKSQELDDILARIPARDVVRVELIRGSGSSAASAQTTRVNVVRRGGAGEGVWNVGAAQSEDGRVAPWGEASWSGRAGEREFGASLAYESDRVPDRGFRSDFDAFGALDERRDEYVPADEREIRVSGEYSSPLLGGDLSLTGEASWAEARERERASIFGAGDALDGVEFSDADGEEDAIELGALYAFDLSSWSAELGALATRRRFEALETAEERGADLALDEATRQTQRIEAGETILRFGAERDLREGWRINLGAEAALNTLEQRLTLTEDDGSGPTPVELPSANVRVEEERAEAFATLSGRALARWTFEAGGSVEVSRLTLSGDDNQSADLTYWKPSLLLARAFGAQNQIRFRFYRDVGQLDFEDFVSAADLQDSQVDAGNPDLRPETSWRAEATGDWRFGENGALELTLYRWWIEDALDLVAVGPPGDQFDAPGNIGDADAWGARIALTAPLPAHAQLRIEGFAQRAEVDDPFTGERRTISEFPEGAVTIGLRQDLSAWRLAWGIDFEQEFEAESYRLDRIDDENERGDLSAWIETSAIDGMKLRLWASQLSDDAETRRRRFFTPDRNGGFDGADFRSRREGRYLGFELSGGF